MEKAIVFMTSSDKLVANFDQFYLNFLIEFAKKEQQMIVFQILLLIKLFSFFRHKKEIVFSSCNESEIRNSK